MDKEYAEIYLIQSTDGKSYVGKANCRDSKGRKHGTYGRWKGHIRDARAVDGGRCRLLNEEIRKYNDMKMFRITPILVCKIEDAWYYERMLIKEFNTLYDKVTNPYGLNINEGGNSGKLSKETRERMSLSRKQYIEMNPHTLTVSQETKDKISNTLIDNVIRYDHNGQVLPKYVKYINWADRRGYQIVSHPKCKCKYFVSKHDDMNVLLDRCILFLTELSC